MLFRSKPFLGNLQPTDIANRLQRTIDYVIPYESAVLPSMNTGSPHILHSRRWERFGRAVNGLIGDLDVWSVDGSRESAASPSPMDARLRTADQKEM